MRRHPHATCSDRNAARDFQVVLDGRRSRDLTAAVAAYRAEDHLPGTTLQLCEPNSGLGHMPLAHRREVSAKAADGVAWIDCRYGRGRTWGGNVERFGNAGKFCGPSGMCRERNRRCHVGR